MSEGLKRIASGAVEGIVKVDVVSVGHVLGGIHNPPRHKLYYLVPFQGEADVGDSFVEIFARTRRPEMTRWRIWFDGVAVTREYRPNYTLPAERGEYSITVINVTPLVKRNPQKTKHKLLIVNEGSEPIELLGSLMIKTYKTPRGRAQLNYATGGVWVDEGATVRLPGVEEAEFPQMSLFSTPLAISSPLHATVSCGGEEAEYSQVSRVGELRLTLPSCTRPELTLATGGPMLLPSVVAVSQEYDKPEPVLGEVEVAEEAGRLRLKVPVENRGSAELERGLLTVFALGEAIARRELETLGPGGFTTVELEARVARDVRALVVRLIWNEYGEPRFVERRVVFRG